MLLTLLACGLPQSPTLQVKALRTVYGRQAAAVYAPPRHPRARAFVPQPDAGIDPHRFGVFGRARTAVAGLPKMGLRRIALRVLGAPQGASRGVRAFIVEAFSGSPAPTGDASEGEVACYLVNSDSDGVNVVCTSSPEKYAWYEGIDREEMEEIAPGSLASSGHLACEEDATFNGEPVWKCK